MRASIPSPRRCTSWCGGGCARGGRERRRTAVRVSMHSRGRQRKTRRRLLHSARCKWNSSKEPGYYGGTGAAASCAAAGRAAACAAEHELAKASEVATTLRSELDEVREVHATAISAAHLEASSARAEAELARSCRSSGSREEEELANLGQGCPHASGHRLVAQMSDSARACLFSICCE